MIEAQAAGTGATRAGAALVDCDVHVDVPRVEALFPYLPAYWIEHIEQTLFKGPVDSYYPSKTSLAGGADGKRIIDAAPTATVETIQQQVLGAQGVQNAVLSCLYAIDSLNNPDAAVAIASAVNDWLIAEWLEKDSRLRASMVVPVQLPALAAREIERVGDHPGFVQVMLPVRTNQPLGNRNFHPLWGAIEKKGLVAGVHFGGAPITPPTPTGWPSYYFEIYAGMAQVFATQMTSIVCEGVFDQFPNVKVAFLESGWTWIPAHMWRFDKEWKNLRRLVPWVRRAPSEYIREHIRVTVQPLDAPENTPKHLLDVFEQLGSEDMLLYSSDFPHPHAADPEEGFLRHLPATAAQKIRSENARALYGLP
jgi:predicted TIM-barrel fold metal-dependent hydrolase